MLLHRLAPVLVTQRRHQQRAILVASSAAVVAAATCLSSERFVDRVGCDSHDRVVSKFTDSSNSMLIPTLQASVRAMRLVSTAFLIVVDYQLAKMETFLPFTVESKEEMETRTLQANLDRHEKVLEEAQIEYSREIPQSEKMLLSVADRKALKAKQKLRMHDAAVQLADAEEKLTSMEGGSSKSRLHKKSAERLLRLCRQNGGVYIKVGQHLANLDYLIPQEYIEVLSSLFDDAPQSSFDDVCSVIEEDLGGKVGDLFDDFDPVPVASASLAQVHVAYDKKTKRKLAVKVQHRGLRESSVGDIYAVTSVVGAIESMLKDFTFAWIADEMAPQLPKELDFVNEGRNAELASAEMKRFGLACCIPKIIWQDTSERVLTMEFEEGFRATDVEALEKSGLSRRYVPYIVFGNLMGPVA